MGSFTLTIICAFANSSSALGSDGDADITKSLVAITALLARMGFDEHFVPPAHQLDAGGGDQTNTALAGLQLTGNANSHVMYRSLAHLAATCAFLNMWPGRIRAARLPVTQCKLHLIT